jgi:hypothetical protein
MKTTVINIKSGEPYDVLIGRPSEWGNPFSHLKKSAAKFKVATRKEAVEKYREWIMTQPELLNKLETLRGKRLGCYCKPLECHGDVLIELLEAKNRASIF